MSRVGLQPIPVPSGTRVEVSGGRFVAEGPKGKVTQPLVDGFNAGILKNVGINFETDALTGYPKLNDTAADAWGGAIGLQYLFNLDQQLVFEAAMVQPFNSDGTGVQDPQYGLGVRYQIALNHSWILRADATYHFIDGAEDNFGVRTELRRKF